MFQYFKSPVAVHFVEGNHVTILNNKKTADIINNCTQLNGNIGSKKLSAETLPSDTLSK